MSSQRERFFDHLQTSLYQQSPRQLTEPARRAACSFKSTPVDFTFGTIYCRDGKGFCSPNSTRIVSEPPTINSNLALKFDPSMDNPAKLHQPRWWSEETAYLAFVDLVPKYTGLGVSLSTPHYRDAMSVDQFTSYKGDRRGYSLEPWRKIAWASVERRMLMMIDSMNIKYSLPPVHQVVQEPLRLRNFYQNQLTFFADANRSLAWFSPITAQMSWAIALAMTLDNESEHYGSSDTSSTLSTRRPSWLDHLSNLRSIFWDEPMLQAVRKCMGCFGPGQAKVGVFINILDPPRYQYSVDWLMAHNIPVYYLWDEAAFLRSQSDPNFARYKPPNHLIQQLVLSVSNLYHLNSIELPEILAEVIRRSGNLNGRVQSSRRSLSPDLTETGRDLLPFDNNAIDDPDEHSHTRPADDYFERSDMDGPAPSLRGTQLPQWLKFFSGRQKALQDAISKENDKQRHARLQRERNPPTVNTKVFMWEEEDGDCKRELVVKSDNDSTLCELRPSQKWYDPIANEWHCSYDFTVNPDADDGECEDDNFYHETTTSLPAQLPEPSATLASDQDLRDVASSDMLSLFREYYGYVPPLSEPRSSSVVVNPVGETTMMHLRNFVGMTKDEVLGVHQYLLRDLADFIAHVLKHTDKDLPLSVPVDGWDLVFGNRQYVGGAQRLRAIRHVLSSSGTTFLMYDFGEARQEDWNLAVSSPSAAIFISRLAPSLSVKEICVELIRRGIAFHTLLPLRKLRHTNPHSMSTDVLPAGYKFTKRDYESYIDFRTDMLNQSRVCRASLMRGGIVWRLSLSHINASEESVLLGPTKYVCQQGMSSDFADGSFQDDLITLDELNTICGTYECLTGKGLQTVTMSWWPPYSIWVQCYDYDYWTHLMEAKFRRRLQELDAGTATPLSRQQWRAWVRGGKITRDAKTSINNACVAFLSRAVSPS